MLEAPGESLDLMDQYNIGYVYISSYERDSFDVDEEWFKANCALVFEEDDVRIYRR